MLPFCIIMLDFVALYMDFIPGFLSNVFEYRDGFIQHICRETRSYIPFFFLHRYHSFINYI